MNFETTCIKTISDTSGLTGQQNLDADIILPDYYDTIGKILRCDIVPRIEAVNVTDDKISIAGAAKVNLVYFGEDKNIYHYENEYKYTKIIQSRHNKKSSDVKIKQNVFSKNYKALGPKRIEIRSIIFISAEIISVNENMVIRSIADDDIKTKQKFFNILNPINASNHVFNVSHNCNITENAGVIKVIVRKISELRISEIKSVRNKIYMKGVCENEIVYLDNSFELKRSIINVPFSEILDMPGTEENDLVRIDKYDAYCDIIFNSDLTDSYDVELRIAIDMFVSVFREEKIEVVDDAYCLSSDLEYNSIDLETITAFDKYTKNECLTVEFEFSDNPEMIICDSFAENFKISIEKHNRKNLALITADYSILYKDKNENYSLVTKEFTVETDMGEFEDDKEIKNSCIRLLSVSALHANGGTVRLNCEIGIDCVYMDICKIKCFTGIVRSEKSFSPKNGFAVCFCNKNEELWDIAKENRTSVEAIKKVNFIDSDVLTEDCVLLLPVF